MCTHYTAVGEDPPQLAAVPELGPFLSPRLCTIGSDYNSPGHCLLPPPHPHILIMTAAGPLLWQAFM